MQRTFRIYTEDLARGDVARIVGARFQGFTILDSTGYWNGTRETSIVIEVVANPSDRAAIHEVARAIKAHNAQAAVLVTETLTDSVLL